MYYNNLATYYKETYHERIYKLPIDGGFTCPNRDGSLGTKGCIFCSDGGSYDYSSSRGKSVFEQLDAARELISGKSDARKFIPYFQTFTNTYGSVERLRSLYSEALSYPNVVGLAIGTRPDCLSDEIIDLLSELNQKTDIYIELGLQTIHDHSAEIIRRGYPTIVYDEAVKKLLAKGIRVVTHLIIGLPGESFEDILASVTHVCQAPIHGIKLQLLHILKDTDLYQYYLDNPFHLPSEEEYVDTIIRLIEHVDENKVIHRVTGDGPEDLLIAPLWSLNKRQVMNRIIQGFKERSSYQGKALNATMRKDSIT